MYYQLWNEVGHCTNCHKEAIPSGWCRAHFIEHTKGPHVSIHLHSTEIKALTEYSADTGGLRVVFTRLYQLPPKFKVPFSSLTLTFQGDAPRLGPRGLNLTKPPCAQCSELWPHSTAPPYAQQKPELHRRKQARYERCFLYPWLLQEFRKNLALNMGHSKDMKKGISPPKLCSHPITTAKSWWVEMSYY